MRRKKKRKYTQKNTGRSNLPLLLALGGFVLVAAALFAIWKSGQPQLANVPVEVAGQPSLKVDKEEIDFGDVKVGDQVSASFTLTNVGDKTLRFTEDPYIEVREGC
jgi:hypothetical protein